MNTEVINANINILIFVIFTLFALSLNPRIDRKQIVFPSSLSYNFLSFFKIKQLKKEGERIKE